MLEDINGQHVFTKPDEDSPILGKHANALRQAGDIKRCIEVIDRLDAKLVDARVKANKEVASAISCSKRIEASPAYLDALHGIERDDVDMPQAAKNDSKSSVVEILLNAVEQMRHGLNADDQDKIAKVLQYVNEVNNPGLQAPVGTKSDPTTPRPRQGCPNEVQPGAAPGLQPGGCEGCPPQEHTGVAPDNQTTTSLDPAFSMIRVKLASINGNQQHSTCELQLKFIGEELVPGQTNCTEFRSSTGLQDSWLHS